MGSAFFVLVPIILVYIGLPFVLVRFLRAAEKKRWRTIFSLLPATLVLPVAIDLSLPRERRINEQATEWKSYTSGELKSYKRIIENGTETVYLPVDDYERYRPWLTTTMQLVVVATLILCMYLAARILLTRRSKMTPKEGAF